jgi:hypothetical protein
MTDTVPMFVTLVHRQRARSVMVGLAVLMATCISQIEHIYLIKPCEKCNNCLGDDRKEDHFGSD